MLEHIYGDKSSGRLSAPPQFNLVPGPSTDIFNNGMSSFTGENDIYGIRTRGGGLNRQMQALNPAKPIQSAQQYQYDIRPDGTILRMRCPTCGAEKFRSMLGFLNHCRIHCKLTFANQEDRLQRCGVAIPPEEVPPEFRNLSDSLIQKSLELAQICADVLPTKIVEDSIPEIHLNEDEPLVLSDFGLTSNGQVAESTSISEEISHKRHSKNQINKEISRFYIKKEIIIGNVSRCLLGSGEVDDSVGGKPATHFFKLFIREINLSKSKYTDGQSSDEQGGILRHIKFARFILHPLYKPNDIIDVYEQPFTIERPAWGEFPIRIQLHFFDERNKPVDLVHMLSIYSSTSSKYDQGVERLHEIEIDRNTDFSLSSAPLERPICLSVVLVSSSDVSDQESLQDNSLSVLRTNQSIITNISQNSGEVDHENLKYCRYCGIPHMPQHSFEIIQKNCAHKPRKIRLNSRTLPSELLSNCHIMEQELDIVPKSSNIPEISLEKELFVDSESSNLVKMVSSSTKLLDLPCFVPIEKTSFVIAAATKCFLKNLLSNSIEKIPLPNNRAALDQKSPSVLTPLHIFQAVTNETVQSTSKDSVNDKRIDSANIFDFISNSYFSASTGSAKVIQ